MSDAIDLSSRHPYSDTNVDHVPQVLFVCVHKAGRSQTAAAMLARIAGRIEGRSAGTTPADSINPVVIDAMIEIGIDLHAAGAQALVSELLEFPLPSE